MFRPAELSAGRVTTQHRQPENAPMRPTAWQGRLARFPGKSATAGVLAVATIRQSRPTAALRRRAAVRSLMCASSIPAPRGRRRHHHQHRSMQILEQIAPGMLHRS